MSRLFNLMQSVTYGVTGLYGEYLQDLANKPSVDYSWLAGHLSDFAIIASGVALGQMISGKNKILQYTTALAPPLMYTLHELGILNLYSGATVYDPQDIACYWGGAALAFGLSKVVSSKKIDSLKNRILRTMEDSL